MALYVGTSGWAYPEWKPDFYPADIPRKSFLAFYTTALGACEINATFYRLQEPETFARWVKHSPPNFRFATKAHRRITHGKTIAIDDDSRTFLQSYLETLRTFGGRLGPVLFQLPAYRKRDDAALASLLAGLPRGLRFAFEFRDESWNDSDIQGTIARAGGTVCISDKEGIAPETLPPGSFAYVRLRRDRYPQRKRAAWRRLLESEGRERDVFVFTKHEGIPAGDPFGGVGLAVWLQRVARRST